MSGAGGRRRARPRRRRPRTRRGRRRPGARAAPVRTAPWRRRRRSAPTRASRGRAARSCAGRRGDRRRVDERVPGEHRRRPSSMTALVVEVADRHDELGARDVDRLHLGDGPAEPAGSPQHRDHEREGELDRRHLRAARERGEDTAVLRRLGSREGGVRREVGEHLHVRSRLRCEERHGQPGVVVVVQVVVDPEARTAEGDDGSRPDGRDHEEVTVVGGEAARWRRAPGPPSCTRASRPRRLSGSPHERGDGAAGVVDALGAARPVDRREERLHEPERRARVGDHEGAPRPPPRTGSRHGVARRRCRVGPRWWTASGRVRAALTRTSAPPSRRRRTSPFAPSLPVPFGSSGSPPPGGRRAAMAKSTTPTRIPTPSQDADRAGSCGGRSGPRASLSSRGLGEHLGTEPALLGHGRGIDVLRCVPRHLEETRGARERRRRARHRAGDRASGSRPSSARAPPPRGRGRRGRRRARASGTAARRARHRRPRAAPPPPASRPAVARRRRRRCPSRPPGRAAARARRPRRR